MNYYDILGVPRNASESDIKRAYRRFITENHPGKLARKSDEERERLEQKVKEVNKAYSVLSNKRLKKIYDEGGDPDNPMPQNFGRNWANGTTINMDDIEMGGFEEILKSFGGGRFSFGDGFSFGKVFNMGGGGAGGSQRGSFNNSGGYSRQKPCKEVTLTASLDEMYSGATRTLRVRRHAFGRTEEKLMKVEIKPGYRKGTRFTFKDYGDQLPDGSFQDIRVVLGEKPDSVFKRVDDDLEMKLRVSLDEFKRGFRKEIALPGKRVHVVTDKDFRTLGEPVTFPSLGMPISKSPGQKGDLKVTCVVDL